MLLAELCWNTTDPFTDFFSFCICFLHTLLGRFEAIFASILTTRFGTVVLFVKISMVYRYWRSDINTLVLATAFKCVNSGICFVCGSLNLGSAVCIRFYTTLSWIVFCQLGKDSLKENPKGNGGVLCVYDKYIIKKHVATANKISLQKSLLCCVCDIVFINISFVDRGISEIKSG